MNPDALTIDHNEAMNRFEVSLNSDTAYIEYVKNDKTISLTSTQVPPAFEGRGIGGRLVKTALDYAQENNLRVIPICPFVVKYIERHPEYQALTNA